MAVRSKWQSLPTEAINPSSLGIDKLAPEDIVDLMVNEDRKMLEAVKRERERIAVGIDMIAVALRKGGRIIFVGAGTSGRLGILESAEMPPTFSTDPELIQALMAGGRDAIFAAKEGVEDDYAEGARSVTRLKPTRKDIVIGVSASGMTPFVRGALTRARQSGARIVFVTCDPATELQTFVDLTIAPGVGAEVIAAHGCTPSFLGYLGYPANLCLSPNDVIVHGIPGDYRLQDGDILSVDAGAIYEGFHGDAAFTMGIGDISDEASRLIEVTEDGMWAGIRHVRKGSRLGDIGAAVFDGLIGNDGMATGRDIKSAAAMMDDGESHD